ncbi:VOC family protein [Cryobacterium sp. BB307]|uniref:VOC family protein n=1 Tax=Cryobacterium sp. BB307 TaxID=2716317 RepID=UPI0014460C73|nr:VOC family protein [Cryobacterium sp. BB307]
MAVRSLFPILSTRDLPALVEFYERALSAEVAYRFPGEDGDDYVSLMIGPASLGIGHDPDVVEAVNAGDRVALWFYVDDVDQAFATALKSGAVETRSPMDMPWGERVAQIRDIDGNLVNLAMELPGV